MRSLALKAPFFVTNFLKSHPTAIEVAVDAAMPSN